MFKLYFIHHLFFSVKIYGYFSSSSWICQDCPRGQSLSLIWKMASTKDRHAELDRRKKRKSIMHVWRPISTQSASNEGFTSSVNYCKWFHA